jgi:hypothetical protein
VQVDAEGGGWRVGSQPARFAARLGQRQAVPAEFLRQGHLQVAGGLQFVEVFLAESVVTVVAGGTSPAAFEQEVSEE